jgi:hypothetical protein
MEKCVHGRNEMFCCDCRYRTHAKKGNMKSKAYQTPIILDTYEAIDEKRVGSRLIAGALLLGI